MLRFTDALPKSGRPFRKRDFLKAVKLNVNNDKDLGCNQMVMAAFLLLFYQI